MNLKTPLIPLTLLALVVCLSQAADQPKDETPTPATRKEERAAKKAAKKGKTADMSQRIPADLKTIPNIVFKKIGETNLDLMIFSPAEKKFEKSPLVVYIHGGGWGNGDKFRVLRHDILPVIHELTKQGVTCATIEYRLANGGASTVFDSAADCKDAIRFLVKNAEKYGLDPDRIGTIGSSAGGHLTLVTALGDDRDYPCDPSLDGPPGNIRCVAAFYPLVSLTDPEVKKGSNFERPERLVPILGGKLADKGEVARKLSPLDLVRAGSPAIFLAHGDQDPALSFHNSIKMRDAAMAKGVPVECIIAKGAAHGLSGESIEPPVTEIDQRCVAFFMKYLTAP